MHQSRDRDAGMNAADGSPGRVERALTALSRALRYQVSIGALIEAAVWLAIPYLAVGFLWATAHDEVTQRIRARLENVFPVGADVTAFGLTAALWPASIEIAEACPAQ